MSGTPTVQLRHDRPGDAHLDWMLARDDGDGPLVTFRVAVRVDGIRPGSRVAARRLPDHRPVYLSYEGPVAEAPGGAGEGAGEGGGDRGGERAAAGRARGIDRGTVRRLATGSIEAWDERDGVWDLIVRWDGETSPDRPGPQHLRLVRGTGDDWTIETLAQP